MPYDDTGAAEVELRLLACERGYDDLAACAFFAGQDRRYSEGASRLDSIEQTSTGWKRSAGSRSGGGGISRKVLIFVRFFNNMIF